LCRGFGERNSARRRAGPGRPREVQGAQCSAGCGGLTPREWFELKSHLDKCEECSEISLQYRILATQGIPTIAAAYAERQEQGKLGHRATWKKLVARVRTGHRPVLDRNEVCAGSCAALRSRRIAASLFARAALAACLVAWSGLGRIAWGCEHMTRPASPQCPRRPAPDARGRKEIRGRAPCWPKPKSSRNCGNKVHYKNENLRNCDRRCARWEITRTNSWRPTTQSEGQLKRDLEAARHSERAASRREPGLSECSS